MGDCQNGNTRHEATSHEIAWQIVDANLNRASEGLRVIEEYVRFGLGDAYFTRLLKEYRHDLTIAWGSHLSESARLSFRDTQADVGTGISTDSEMTRGNLASVAAANFQRVLQSLRSLEEYGKLLSPPFAKDCESIRYRVYTLEQAILGVQRNSSALSQARVYVLIDGKTDLETFDRCAREMIDHADVVQLRDKQMNDRELLARARRLRSLTRGTGCVFIVNDRPDIAVLSDADGVHVGQDELGVAAVRRIVGERLFVGVSTHNLEQLRKAILDGASYLGCGPVFSSRTKEFSKFAGVEFLRDAAGETSLPCFAIGGINLDNLDQVIAAGFRRVAIQGALLDHEKSPGEVIKMIKEKLLAAERA